MLLHPNKKDEPNTVRLFRCKQTTVSRTDNRKAIVVREEVESFKQGRYKTTLNLLLFFFDFQVIDMIATQSHGCCLRWELDNDMSLSRHMVVAVWYGFYIDL